MRKTLIVTTLIVGMLQVGVRTQQANALSFFKNYFVTGDYAVGGVGLRGMGVNGIATGSIGISGVPDGADVLAAYLYWQVVTKSAIGPDSGNTSVTFRGHPLLSASGPFGKLLGAGTPPCWSSGGSAGSSDGSKVTYTYRADVLRLFDADPVTGKLSVNGFHQVQLPDAGSNGNGVPIALGASLVVVYRSTSANAPLSAIVLYDGGFTLNNSSPTMFQAIGGFYQPSLTPNAKLTHIVGSAQSNKSETLNFNGSPIPGVLNPFSAAAGPSWDNPTFAVSLGATPDQLTAVTTSVAPATDCLTWGAVIFKTDVKNSDGDGLVDVWKTSDAPIYDPNGLALPNLKAMGAKPGEKDLFIQLGYMATTADTSYGGVIKAAHTHLPTPEALGLMGDSFAAHGIAVHFDVGPVAAADPNYAASPYVIPAGYARGGGAIPEANTLCTRSSTDEPWVCQFGPQATTVSGSPALTAGYPGTVGWKTGFKLLKDQLVNPPPLNADGSDPCDAPGNDAPGQPCERRFDHNRKDMFHYALFSHAVGLPKSEQPCLDSLGNAVPPSIASGRCDSPLVDNPDFHAPRTNSGVGDFPGGDVMITLGAFVDTSGSPVGTPFMQASTLMHELGHNFERRHGGEALEPNCKPTYMSVMNYLYQLRGLLDDGGRPHLDYSGEVNAGINETNLLDGPLSFPVPYRIGWYAPLAGSIFDGRANAASRHCDGSEILPTDQPMVRIDLRTRTSFIDWNANGIAGVSPFSLDVNFSGLLEGGNGLRGSDDWDNIRLNQVGGRRNTGGMFIVDSTGHLIVGPLSLDAGRGDLGRGDLGRGDLGRGDLGRGDLGRGDLGRGDLGRGDLGRGDLGRGDLGRGDLGRGDLGSGDLFTHLLPDGTPVRDGELDLQTAGDLAKTPPIEFTAIVSTAPNVVTGWKAPNIGGVASYTVNRVPGSTLLPQQQWTAVPGTPQQVGPGQYSLTDSTATYASTYTYFAIATYTDGVSSDPSNLVTVTTPKAQSSTAVACPASVAYTGAAQTPCTASFATTDGQSGSLAVTYTPNINAGTVTASAAYAGDAIRDGSFGSATFTITRLAASVTPAAAGKTYGALDPALSGTLVGFVATDAVTATYSRTAGESTGTYTISATLAPVAVLGNYNTTYNTATFTIAKAPSSVTVLCPASVAYNGTAQAPCSATVSGVGTGITQSVTWTYSNNTNVGTATAAASYAGDVNHGPSSNSAAFGIVPAISTTVVTCPVSVVYNGAAQTPCSATVSGVGTGITQSVMWTYSNNTNPGTATASASYAGDVNHGVSSGVSTFTILLPALPTITAAANPNTLLWSPNKTMTPVTVGGVATGYGVTTASYAVTDEYGYIQPTGSAAVGAGGAYSFVVKLEAYRLGSDSDGRHYTITVKTTDRFGRTATATTVVLVPHNQ